MKLKLLFVYIVVVCGVYSHAENTASPFDLITSSSPESRQEGFYLLTKYAPVEDRIEYDCGFTVPDVAHAKKALIGLLRQENTFEIKEYYQAQFGIKSSEKTAFQNPHADSFKKYSFAMEAYGEYMSDLMRFVDSCEDESAANLFPGEKTFSRHYKKSIEFAILELEKPTGGLKYKSSYMLIKLAGRAAQKHSESDEKVHKKVKAWLIRLAENSEYANAAVSVMGEMGDPDFIPILRRLSELDDSHGKSLRLNDGSTRVISPIAREAKKALDKIKRHGKTIQNSATEQTNSN